MNKYPQKLAEVNDSELGKKLNWYNYKAEFDTILDRGKLKTDLETSSKRVKDNIIPSGTAICC